MACKVLEGVQMDAPLNQEQRHLLMKGTSRVVWAIAVDGQGTKKDDLDTKDHAFFAGVCISSKGHILTTSHIVKPGAKYFGTCSSWKAGSTLMRVVKRSKAYGLCLLQLEGKNRKKAEYANVAESGVLGVNQHLYGFGHPNVSKHLATNTYARGSVEYPCEDITELPACFDDYLDQLSTHLLEEVQIVDHVNTETAHLKALALSPRMVKHLVWLNRVKSTAQTAILEMHGDIPLVQIKNLHLGYCGGPVFVSSGHIFGINVYKFSDTINFAVHVSAIKEFLKDVDLSAK